jgi:hypothetical protein
MPIRQSLGYFFGFLAIIFFVLAFRRPLDRDRSVTAKAHWRIGLIFAAVSLYLLLIQRF